MFTVRTVQWQMVLCIVLNSSCIIDESNCPPLLWITRLITTNYYSLYIEDKVYQSTGTNYRYSLYSEGGRALFYFYQRGTKCSVLHLLYHRGRKSSVLHLP